MSQVTRERWDLGGTQMEELLSDVARFKGESLWQDAWRRLKANRASWYALVFLMIFGGISLLAPVLPLPSPTAIAQGLRPERAADAVFEAAPPGVPRVVAAPKEATLAAPAARAGYPPHSP